MPKVAIDISPTLDGNSVRGMGYYVKNLVLSLQSEVNTNPDFNNWQIDLITDHRSLIADHYDLVHYPYFDFYKLTLPPKQPTPTIVTVPDLTPRQFKTHYPVGLKGEIKWLIQKHRLRQVNYIITISNYSKHVIKDIVGYPEDRIYVTWLAANSSFKPRKPSKIIQHKYNLPDKFVLYVGDINWNKNIPGLVKACLSLKYPLVIAGSAATQKVVNHPWTQDILWLQQQKSPLIYLLGFIPDNDNAALYNLATIYCQPSYAEGFGLPPIEAIKSGCPVAYSQETSLPEIMNFSGEFFNPYSINSIKQALKKLWTNPALRQKYIKLGLKHAKIFNWQYTARQTLSIYRLALLNEK